MEQHRFYQLDCSGEFAEVGEPEDIWTEEEMEEILPRVRDLAVDPARGSKIGETGLEEAAVALTAENLEIFDRLTRETTGGAEFEDENGVAWDVKSPFSPPENHQYWKYDANHHLEVLRKDFGQGDKVLFNLTRLNDKDLQATFHCLETNLTCHERDDLLILADHPPQAS